jgi:hypothetical protein
MSVAALLIHAAASSPSQFDDRASTTIINRNLSTPVFQTLLQNATSLRVSIPESGIFVSYDAPSGANANNSFPGTLLIWSNTSVTYANNGSGGWSWQPGQSQLGNLNGT